MIAAGVAVIPRARVVVIRTYKIRARCIFMVPPGLV